MINRFLKDKVLQEKQGLHKKKEETGMNLTDATSQGDKKKKRNKINIFSIESK